MINHTINKIITGEAKLQDKGKDGSIKVSGNKEKVSASLNNNRLIKLFNSLKNFTPCIIFQ